MRITEYDNAVTFSVKVQPRSSVNRIIVLKGDILKVKLTSPPIEGAANKALIEYLADEMNIRKSRISIIKGQKLKNKVIRITGIKVSELQEKLKRFL